MRHAALFVVYLCVINCAVFASGPAGYGPAKHITVGGDGGWDYLTFDSGNHRVFITRATRVMVVDPDSGKSVGEIPDTPGIHGVALVADLGRGFTSNGRESMVTIFDLKTLKAISKVKTGDGPDAIVYDPKSRRVFTFNAHGQSATAIDAAEGKPVGDVPLGGKPEFAAPDGKGRMYVNIEDKNELAVIDTEKLAVTAHWPLPGCEEPSGLALDREHRRLFSGCGNKVMLVVNADTGKVITTLPIGQGVDATAFDAGTQLAFASNGDGTLTVVHEDGPDKYSVVGNVETARGARTMALDPDTHTVYLVTAKFGPKPQPTAENPRGRPPILPGTFELIVVPKQ
ncbi:MAG: YncE family protein [Acidobacteria bacterium]|nr:YncE family protein [Acidobacteriota bacterium]